MSRSSVIEIEWTLLNLMKSSYYVYPGRIKTKRIGKYWEADFSNVAQMKIAPLPKEKTNYELLTELKKKIPLDKFADYYLHEKRKSIALFITDHLAKGRLLYDYASQPTPWYDFFLKDGWRSNGNGNQSFIHLVNLAQQFYLMREDEALTKMEEALKEEENAKDEKSRKKNEIKKLFYRKIAMRLNEYLVTKDYFTGKRAIDEIMMYCLAGTSNARQTKSMSMQEKWDENPSYIVPLKNGIVDLKERIFRRYAPDDFILCKNDLDFDPDARCPLWEKVISEIFLGDQELISWVHRFLGYTLTRDPQLDKVVFFYGPTGRNGKSLIGDTLLYVLGNLATRIESTTLLENGIQNRNAATPDMLDMRGRALCVISELNRTAKLNIALLKALTGGDMMTGRNLYSPIIQKFMPVHTFLILTNHRPSADATDEAFWKRVIVIPFNATYSDDPGANEFKMDTDLEQKLQAEKAGIMNWLIEGAFAYFQNPRLNDLPAAIKKATGEYREAEDTLNDFFEDCCQLGEQHQVPTATLYAAYRQWCYKIAGQTRVSSQKTFRESLAKKNIHYKRTKNARFYSGIALLPECDLIELLGDKDHWR